MVNQIVTNFRSFFKQTILFLMAIFIFNMSIDVPDEFNDFVKENLSFNEIESVGELIMEDILGFENFFEEQEDDDSDEKTSFFKKIQFEHTHRELIPMFNWFTQKDVSDIPVEKEREIQQVEKKRLDKPPIPSLS